jgi:hypothetical protein
MHTIIVMPEAHVVAANAVAAAMQFATDGTSGGDNFSVPLYAIDAETDAVIVARWCGVALNAENRAAAPGLLEQFPGSSLHDYDQVANPGFPTALLQSLGLRRATTIID